MTILRSAMYVKVDSVDVLKYVQSYDLTQGRSQPFPILRLILAPANTVDALTTVAEGKVVEVNASGEGTFLITDVDKTDNEYHITAVHESVQLKAMQYPVWLHFDGDGDYVHCGDGVIYAQGPAGVSHGAFFRYLGQGTGTDKRGFIHESQSYNIALNVETDGTLATTLNTTTTTALLKSTATPTVGEWHHAMATYDGSTLRLYLDGTEVASTARTGDALVCEGLRIGTYRDNNDRWWKGDIRDTRIYDRALSASEVAELADGRNISTGLVAHYPTKEGAGDVLKDRVGGNNGTIGGATWNTFGQPEELFTTLMEYVGYDGADIDAPATSYGDIAIPGGENAWGVIKYLADLTGRRAFFTSSKAYFVGTGTTKTIALGGASPTVNVLGRPIITRNNEDVINSMRVFYEMGEVTDSDATSISIHGERREERRSLTTEDSDSHALPRVDAVNLASQLIADNKEPITGISYQVNERKRDVSNNQVWEATYDITDLGTITDNYTSTSVTAVPLERVTHHLPLYGSTYEWGRVSKGLGNDLSQLGSEVADRVHNGTLGNDLSSRPVAIQVYGDQDLEGFDPSTLTGFYLGKLKDGSGNDVYIWAGVNSGTEQVRMDTDGKMKAGGGKLTMDADGIHLNCTGAESVVKQNSIRFVDDALEVSDVLQSYIGYTHPSSSNGNLRMFSPADMSFGCFGDIQIAPNAGQTLVIGDPVGVGANLRVGVQTIDILTGTITSHCTGTVTQSAIGDIVLSGRRLDSSGCSQIVIPTGTSDPSSPIAGSMYFNTSNNQLRIYDGSTWRYEEL